MPDPLKYLNRQEVRPVEEELDRDVLETPATKKKEKQQEKPLNLETRPGTGLFSSRGEVRVEGEAKPVKTAPKTEPKTRHEPFKVDIEEEFGDEIDLSVPITGEEAKYRSEIELPQIGRAEGGKGASIPEFQENPNIEQLIKEDDVVANTSLYSVLRERKKDFDSLQSAFEEKKKEISSTEKSIINEFKKANEEINTKYNSEFERLNKDYQQKGEKAETEEEGNKLRQEYETEWNKVKGQYDTELKDLEKNYAAKAEEFEKGIQEFDPAELDKREGVVPPEFEKDLRGWLKNLPPHYQGQKREIERSAITILEAFAGTDAYEQAKDEVYRIIRDEVLFDKEGNPTSFLLKDTAEMEKRLMADELEAISNEYRKAKQKEIEKFRSFSGERALSPEESMMLQLNVSDPKIKELEKRRGYLNLAVSIYDQISKLPEETSGKGKWIDYKTGFSVPRNVLLNTLTGGMVEAVEGGMSLGIWNKVRKGEPVTKEEQQYINALSLYTTTLEKVMPDWNAWMKGGWGTAKSLPWITSIVMTRGLYSAAKLGTLKLLGSAGWKMGQKWTLKTAGAVLAGEVAGAVARTPAQFPFYKEAIDQYIQPSLKIGKEGLEGEMEKTGKTIGGALGKALMVQSVENLGEMTGAYMEVPLKKATSKAMKWTAKKLGMSSKSVSSATKILQKHLSAFKVPAAVREHAQIQGLLTEYLEEVVTDALHIVTGNQPPPQLGTEAGRKEFFTDQWATFISVASMVGSMQIGSGVLQTGVRAITKEKAQQGLRAQFSEGHVQMIELIASIKNTKAKSILLTDFIQSNKIDDAERLGAIGEYVWASQVEQSKVEGKKVAEAKEPTDESMAISQKINDAETVEEIKNVVEETKELTPEEQLEAEKAQKLLEAQEEFEESVAESTSPQETDAKVEEYAKKVRQIEDEYDAKIEGAEEVKAEPEAEEVKPELKAEPKAKPEVAPEVKEEKPAEEKPSEEAKPQVEEKPKEEKKPEIEEKPKEEKIEVKSEPEEKTKEAGEEKPKWTVQEIEGTEAEEGIEIPETPADERRAGYKIIKGIRFNRQKKIKNKVVGKETNLEFADTAETPKGKWTVMEANEGQASHVNARLNPLNFVNDAQPKDRAEVGSEVASEKMADNLEPHKITHNTTNAYFGAPTVNERGEAIQGNNRLRGLQKYWQKYSHDPKGYKQFLIDHAEELGLDPKAIAEMTAPVLVNMVAVSDADAVEYGMHTELDLTTGGVQRIKPVETARKLGDRIERLIAMLLEGEYDDITVRELIKLNGQKALTVLLHQKVINDTQFQSAFKNGQITADAAEDLYRVITHALFQGARPDLNNLFELLPYNLKMGIIKSVPKIVKETGLKLEIQRMILAYQYFLTSQWKDSGIKAIPVWSKSTDLINQVQPIHEFGKVPIALLQKLLTIKKQKDIVAFFDLYDERVLGKKEGMFPEPGIGKTKAIEELLNIPENEQRRVPQTVRTSAVAEAADRQGAELAPRESPDKDSGIEDEGAEGEKPAKEKPEVKVKEKPEAKESTKEKEQPKQEYRYKLKLRPFDIGTYPKDGFVRAEQSEDGGFETLIYDRKLSKKDRQHFSLLPLTEIEEIKDKTLVDKDGYYSRIELKFTPNDEWAMVSLYDQEGNLVDEISMSYTDIMTNIEEGYWFEKPSDKDVKLSVSETEKETVKSEKEKKFTETKKETAKPEGVKGTEKAKSEQKKATVKPLKRKVFDNITDEIAEARTPEQVKAIDTKGDTQLALLAERQIRLIAEREKYAARISRLGETEGSREAIRTVALEYLSEVADLNALYRAKVSAARREMARDSFKSFEGLRKALNLKDTKVQAILGEGTFSGKVGGVDVVLREGEQADEVVIESMRVPKVYRRKGKASRALARIIAEADNREMTLRLRAVPEQGAEITETQLKNFYKRHGFVFEGEGIEGIRPPLFYNIKTTESIKQAYRDLSATAHNALPTEWVQTEEDLPEHIHEEAAKYQVTEGKKLGIDGVYDPITQRVWIVADNIFSVSDLYRVWLHEQVGHHGIRLLFPDKTERNKFYQEVFALVGEEGIKEVVSETEWDRYERSERTDEAKANLGDEYLAYLTEKAIDRKSLPPKERNILQKIIDWIKKQIRLLFGEKTLEGLSKEDIVSILNSATRKVYAKEKLKPEKTESHAKETGKDIETEGKQAGVERGAEEGVHIRDSEKDRMEVKEGEEIRLALHREVEGTPEYKLAVKVRDILSERGITKSFSASKTEHGVSLYFEVGMGFPSKLKVRISDHPVESNQRWLNEQHESSLSDPYKIANDIEYAMHPERFDKKEIRREYYSKYDGKLIKDSEVDKKAQTAWQQEKRREVSERFIDKINQDENLRLVEQIFAKKAKKGHDLYNIIYERKVEVESKPVYERVRKADIPQAKFSLIEKAKEHFGTTTDYREAGYLTPDGTMIDFSGTKFGMMDGGRKARYMDHREIQDIGTDIFEFMALGNIRLLEDGFDIVRKPTLKQLNVIKKIVTLNDGDVYVDFSRPDGLVEHSAEYSNARPSKVAGDIVNFYENKIKPEGVKFSTSYKDVLKNLKNIPDEIDAEVESIAGAAADMTGSLTFAKGLRNVVGGEVVVLLSKKTGDPVYAALLYNNKLVDIHGEWAPTKLYKDVRDRIKINISGHRAIEKGDLSGFHDPSMKEINQVARVISTISAKDVISRSLSRLVRGGFITEGQKPAIMKKIDGELSRIASEGKPLTEADKAYAFLHWLTSEKAVRLKEGEVKELSRIIYDMLDSLRLDEKKKITVGQYNAIIRRLGDANTVKKMEALLDYVMDTVIGGYGAKYKAALALAKMRQDKIRDANKGERSLFGTARDIADLVANIDLAELSLEELNDFTSLASKIFPTKRVPSIGHLLVLNDLFGEHQKEAKEKAEITPESAADIINSIKSIGEVKIESVEDYLNFRRRLNRYEKKFYELISEMDDETADNLAAQFDVEIAQLIEDTKKQIAAIREELEDFHLAYVNFLMGKLRGEATFKGIELLDDPLIADYARGLAESDLKDIKELDMEILVDMNTVISNLREGHYTPALAEMRRQVDINRKRRTYVQPAFEIIAADKSKVWGKRQTKGGKRGLIKSQRGLASELFTQIRTLQPFRIDVFLGNFSRTKRLGRTITDVGNTINQIEQSEAVFDYLAGKAYHKFQKGKSAKEQEQWRKWIYIYKAMVRWQNSEHFSEDVPNPFHNVFEDNYIDQYRMVDDPLTFDRDKKMYLDFIEFMKDKGAIEFYGEKNTPILKINEALEVMRSDEGVISMLEWIENVIRDYESMHKFAAMYNGWSIKFDEAGDYIPFQRKFKGDNWESLLKTERWLARNTNNIAYIAGATHEWTGRAMYMETDIVRVMKNYTGMILRNAFLAPALRENAEAIRTASSRVSAKVAETTPDGKDNNIGLLGRTLVKSLRSRVNAFYARDVYDNAFRNAFRKGEVAVKKALLVKGEKFMSEFTANIFRAMFAAGRVPVASIKSLKDNSQFWKAVIDEYINRGMWSRYSTEVSYKVLGGAVGAGIMKQLGKVGEAAADWVIYFPDATLGKILFVDSFLQEFQRLSGEEFNIDLWQTNQDYRMAHIDAFEESSYFSSTRLEELYNSKNPLSEPELRTFFNKLIKLDRKSEIGRLFYFFMSFGQNETWHIGDSIRRMRHGDAKTRAMAARDIGGLVVSNYVYAMIRQYLTVLAYSELYKPALDLLFLPFPFGDFDDDEQKKEFEEQFAQLQAEDKEYWDVRRKTFFSGKFALDMAMYRVPLDFLIGGSDDLVEYMGKWFLYAFESTRGLTPEQKSAIYTFFEKRFYDTIPVGFAHTEQVVKAVLPSMASLMAEDVFSFLSSLKEARMGDIASSLFWAVADAEKAGKITRHQSQELINLWIVPSKYLMPFRPTVPIVERYIRTELRKIRKFEKEIKKQSKGKSGSQTQTGAKSPLGL